MTTEMSETHQALPDDPVTVAVCYGSVEASIIQSVLASEDISSYLKRESIGELSRLMVDGLARTEVVVAARDAARAQAALAAAKPQPGEADRHDVDE